MSAKVIMVQGTMSNAGKSLLTAALCRIFKQDGYRAAPFKSQNMALNSYITDQGLEMGRAQVMQAHAAGIVPEAAMNPILLKPTNDTGSQVIVNGRVFGQMDAKTYFACKKQFLPDIRRAYEDLASRFDIIVIEGAGSPAEINLKENDIVNMGLARLVDAPVLLVGDIDRGGVFAQLVGTLELLEEDERARVKGLVINKFRGDKSILTPGVELLEKRCHIPVVGVTPYVCVDVEDEDSLSERFARTNETGVIDIAVIRFPRIANFTDFFVLENHPMVKLRYVSRAFDLGNPDMVILPGTKNSMGDLRWMRESGMESAVKKIHAGGAVIFGICGGYQMLGELLSDPLGIEDGGELRGLELLPIQTIYENRKLCTRVEGAFGDLEGIFSGLSGLPVSGYEIHMGESRALCEDFLPCSHLRDTVTGAQKSDGMCQGNVYGSYVHGIFDEEHTVPVMLQALAEKKGVVLEHPQPVSLEQYRETQYDLLADSFRQNLDMEAVYRILD